MSDWLIDWLIDWLANWLMRSRIKVQWNLTSASWSHMSSKLAPHITFWVFIRHDTGPFSSLLRPVPCNLPENVAQYKMTWDIPNHGDSICWNSRRNRFETNNSHAKCTKYAQSTFDMSWYVLWPNALQEALKNIKQVHLWCQVEWIWKAHVSSQACC